MCSVVKASLWSTVLFSALALSTSKTLNLRTPDTCDTLSTNCRCTNPDDPCWPSLQEWSQLKNDVEGRLYIPFDPYKNCWSESPIQARTVGDVSYRLGTPNLAEQCEGWREEFGRNGTFNSFFFQDFEGQSLSYQYKDTPYGQSQYVVDAQTESDIQAAVTFAAKHNLRVVIKGSAHSYFMQNNAKDSLLIWTHHMQRIQWSDDLSSVTVAAGVEWSEVFMQMQTRGRLVVGGGTPSVGAAGGFILGGGLSTYKKLGTAADNLLSAKVVLADGSLVEASETSNPELFWALRGGGGGTFGVVTEVTYKTHSYPEHITAASSMTICASRGSFETATSAIFQMIAKMNNISNFIDQGISVNFFLNDGQYYAMIEGGLFTDKDTVESIYKAYEDAVQPIEDCNYNQTFAPTEFDHIAVEGSNMTVPYWWPRHANDSGGFGPQLTPVWPSEGSNWTMSNPVFGSNDASQNLWLGFSSSYVGLKEIATQPNQLAKNISSLLDTMFPGRPLVFQTFKSQGALEPDGQTVRPVKPESATAQGKTSMHPGLLKAGGFLIISTDVPSYSMVPNGQAVEFSRLPHIQFINIYCQQFQKMNITMACDATQPEAEASCSKAYDECISSYDQSHFDTIFEDMFPDMGTFLNEANVDMENRMERFWTKEKYHRLLKVKHEVDPDGLFVCRGCVASEEWSKDGNCRVDGNCGR